MSAQRRSGIIAALRRRLARTFARAPAMRAADDDAMWSTLARYCANDLPVAETRRVEAWSAESAERERLRRGLLRITAASRAVRTVYQREAAWEQLKRQIAATERTIPGRRTPLHTAGSARRLHVGRGHRTPARRAAWSAMIAAAALLAAGALQWSGRVDLFDWARAPDIRTYAAGRGERRSVELPDGSRVVLGAESAIRIDARRFARARTVHLEGIAHFAVAHDRRHPFIVYAGGAAAQAVGTAFTVRAYAEDSAAQVVVDHGRVLLRTGDAPEGTGVPLDPGDLGEQRPGEAATITHHVDLTRYTGWMDGRLTYELAPARLVARDLERWYRVRIVFADTSLARAHVTAFFDASRSPEQAMQLLATIVGVHYAQHGDTVTLGAD
ncbi:MAG: FecR domain-containing protein [Gemmatimonadaceae bacterium]|nr:FecR domain-containing protein [Gemmatimonadaceae bacterium]